MSDENADRSGDWLHKPFMNLLGFLKESTDAVSTVTSSTVKLINVNGELIDLHQEGLLDGATCEHLLELISLNQEMRDKLGHLLDTEFWTIYAQGMVFLWTALETFAEDFLATWITHIPDARSVDSLGKIKVSVLEFERLTVEERYRFVVKQLADTQEVRSKRGADRFEALWRPFGLSGRVDQQVMSAVRELHLFRNAIVHDRGYVSRRLADELGQLDLVVGERVPANRSTYDKYADAVAAYIITLLERLDAAA